MARDYEIGSRMLSSRSSQTNLVAEKSFSKHAGVNNQQENQNNQFKFCSSSCLDDGEATKKVMIEISSWQSLCVELNQSKVLRIYLLNKYQIKKEVTQQNNEFCKEIEKLVRQSYEPHVISKVILKKYKIDCEGRASVRNGNQLIGGGCGVSSAKQNDVTSAQKVQKELKFKQGGNFNLSGNGMNDLNLINETRTKILNSNVDSEINKELLTIAKVLEQNYSMLFSTAYKQFNAVFLELISMYKDYLVLRIGKKVKSLNKARGIEQQVAQPAAVAASVAVAAAASVPAKEKKETKKQLLESFLTKIKGQQKYYDIDFQFEIDLINQMSNIETIKQLPQDRLAGLSEDIFWVFQLEDGKVDQGRKDALTRVIQFSNEHRQKNPLMDYLEMRGKLIFQQISGVDKVSSFTQLMNADVYSKSEYKYLEVLNRISTQVQMEITNKNADKLKKLSLQNDVIVSFIREAITLGTNVVQAKRIKIFKQIEEKWNTVPAVRIIVMKVLLHIYEICILNQENDVELFEDVCIQIFLIDNKYQDEMKHLIASVPGLKDKLERGKKDPKLQKMIKQVKGPLAITDSSVINLIKQRAKIIGFSSQQLLINSVEENLQFYIENIAGVRLEDPDGLTAPDRVITSRFFLEGKAQVLILGGGFGSGKSIVVKKMFKYMLTIIDKKLESIDSQKIFLYVKQNMLDLQNPSIDVILKKSPFKQSPEQVEWIKKLPNPKLIFIDGFTQLKHRQTELKNLINSLQEWQNVKVIVSTCELKADLEKIDWNNMMPMNEQYSVIQLHSELTTPSDPSNNQLDAVLTRLTSQIGQFQVSKLFSVPANLFMLQHIIKEKPYAEITNLTSLVEQYVDVQIASVKKNKNVDDETVELMVKIKRESIKIFEDIALMIYLKHGQQSIPNDDNSAPISQSKLLKSEVDLVREMGIVKTFVSEEYIFAEKNESAYFSLRVVQEYFLARGLLREFEDETLVFNEKSFQKYQSFPINHRLIVSNKYLPVEKRILKMLYNVHFKNATKESYVNGKLSRVIKYAQLAKAIGNSRTSSLQNGAANIVSALAIGKKEFPFKINFDGISLQGAYLNNMKHENISFDYSNLKNASLTNSRIDEMIKTQFDSASFFPVQFIFAYQHSQSIFTYSEKFLNKYTRQSSASNEYVLDCYLKLEELNNFSVSSRYIYACISSKNVARIDPFTLEYTIFSWQQQNISSCFVNSNDSIHLLGEVGGDLLLVDFEKKDEVLDRISFNEQIMTIEVGPSDSAIACVATAQTVIVLTIKGNKMTQKYVIQSGYLSCLVLSPNGKYLASGKPSGSVAISQLDEQTGEFIQIKEYSSVHEDRINWFHFSPCSTMLASSSADGKVSLCDIKKECKVTDVISGNGAVFLNDTTQLATFLYHTDFFNIMKHDGSAWQVEQKVENKKYSANSLSFSPSGEFLAAGCSDRTIKIWDMKSNLILPQHVLKGHSKAVLSVKFSPKGTYLASSSNDKTVIIWDPKNSYTQIAIHKITHEDAINAVAFSPDEKHIATASWDYTFKVWDLQTAKNLPITTSSDLPHSHSVFCIEYSNCGRYLATGSGDCTVKIWDAQSYSWKHTIESNKGWVYALTFSSDSKFLVTGSKDCFFKTFQIDKQFQMIDTYQNSSQITAVAVSKNQLYQFFGDRQPKFKLDLFSQSVTNNDVLIDEWQPRKGNINSIALFEDTVAFASSAELVIKKLPSEYSINKQAFSNAYINEIFFSKTGLLFTLYTSGLLKIYDSKNEFELLVEKAFIACDAIFPSYNCSTLILISFQNEIIKLFDFTKKDIPEIASFEERFESIKDMTISPSGKYVVLANEDTFRIRSSSDNYQSEITYGINTEISPLNFDQYCQYFQSEKYKSFDFLENVQMTKYEDKQFKNTICLSFTPDEKMSFFRIDELFYQFDEEFNQIHQPFELVSLDQLQPMRIISAETEQVIGRTVPLSLQKWNYVQYQSKLSYCGKYIANIDDNGLNILIYELNDICIASTTYEDQIENPEEPQEQPDEIASEQVEENKQLNPSESVAQPKPPAEVKVKKIEIIEFAPLGEPNFTL